MFHPLQCSFLSFKTPPFMDTLQRANMLSLPLNNITLILSQLQIEHSTTTSIRHSATRTNLQLSIGNEDSRSDDDSVSNSITQIIQEVIKPLTFFFTRKTIVLQNTSTSSSTTITTDTGNLIFLTILINFQQRLAQNQPC